MEFHSTFGNNNMHACGILGKYLLPVLTTTTLRTELRGDAQNWRLERRCTELETGEEMHQDEQN